MPPPLGPAREGAVLRPLSWTARCRNAVSCSLARCFLYGRNSLLLLLLLLLLLVLLSGFNRSICFTDLKANREYYLYYYDAIYVGLIETNCFCSAVIERKTTLQCLKNKEIEGVRLGK